jgi:hypothetical protein
MQACDFGDAPATYGIAGHKLDTAVTLTAQLQIGSVLDYEYEQLSSSDALADDQYWSSNPSVGVDEEGVIFRSPAGTGKSIFADVTVINSTASSVTVCGWFDVVGGVSNAFEPADGQCLPAAPGSNTISFQWSALPTDHEYTTFARFRLSSQLLTTSDATGDFPDGEVEDYQVIFDFSPTAVTIGRVELQAVRVSDFLAGLDVDQMDRAALLALLQAWNPEAAAALAADAGSAEILAALHRYLDPDGDAQVAVLAWDTLEERGTIGFYVDRRQDESAWTRINNDMLPGLINAPMGGEYRLADPDVTTGSYQYRLIEQEARGTTRFYGPFDVRLP